MKKFTFFLSYKYYIIISLIINLLLVGIIQLIVNIYRYTKWQIKLHILYYWAKWLIWSIKRKNKIKE